MLQNKPMELLLNNIINVLKPIIQSAYFPYTAILFLIIVILFLIPKIALVSTINKSTKLFNNKKYFDVIRNIENFFKIHKYDKVLLTLLYKSYLNIENKQKALHYMQLMIEKGFINDKYIKLFHNTTMAEILYELNQTQEAFSKLFEIEKEGEYDARWCNLIGKLFMILNQYENAIYYFERALFISPKNIDYYEDYIVALFLKLKEKSSQDAMSLFITHAKKESIFIVSLNNIFKKDYSNASLWLTKANFVGDEIFECYKQFLLLYCMFLMNQDLNSQKTSFLISLDKALHSQNRESEKSRLLELSIFLLFFVKDINNANHFLSVGRNTFNLFSSDLDKSIDNVEQIMNEDRINNYLKRINTGSIILDIFGYSSKRIFMPPINYLKREFAKITKDKPQSEEMKKKILSAYQRLTDRGFIKVNLRIVKLFEYYPKKIRSSFSTEKDVASLRVFALSISYPHTGALFVFRRSALYDLTYALFQAINKEIEENNLESCFFFFNFALDPDVQHYIEDFPKIKIYDQSRLALFLEESLELKKSETSINA